MFCKNCKYFTIEESPHCLGPLKINSRHFIKNPMSPEESRISIGSCSNPIFHVGYGDVENTETLRNGAIIENDEGWGWYVATEFGCIHFEAVGE